MQGDSDAQLHYLSDCFDLRESQEFRLSSFAPYREVDG